MQARKKLEDYQAEAISEQSYMREVAEKERSCLDARLQEVSELTFLVVGYYTWIIISSLQIPINCSKMTMRSAWAGQLGAARCSRTAQPGDG